MQDHLPKPWANLMLFARKDLVAKDSEGVKKLITTYLQASDYVLKNPSWAKALIVKDFGHTPKTSALVYSVFYYTKTGKIDPRVLTNAINFLVEFKLVKKGEAPKLADLLAPGVSR